MKKLMTVIAAAAMSFGLFAEEQPVIGDGTSFEKAGETEIVGPLATAVANAALKELAEGKQSAQASYWDLGELTTEATIASFSAEGETKCDNRPWQYGPALANLYFLKLATGTNSVTRYAKGNAFSHDVATEGSYFFDSVVKLSVFDSDPEIDDTAKFAVWLQEEIDTETQEPTATNLCVKVGGTTETFKCGDAAAYADTWARVTVKAMKITEAGQIGFVLYLNTNVMNAEGSVSYEGINLTPEAMAYSKNRQLFPYNGKGTTIASVSFQGQGAVDDIAFSTEIPDPDNRFAQDPAVAQIKINDDAVGIVDVVSTNGVAITQFPALIEKGVTVVVTAKGAYMDKTYENVQGTLEIEAADFDPVLATFNDGTTTTKYAAMSAVIEKAYGETAGTIAIVADEVNGFTFSNNVSGTITLDLAGKTVKGNAGYDTAIVVDSGTLVITNSADTIGVVNGTNNDKGQSVEATDGTVVIQAGKFIGAALGSYVKCWTGGQFTVKPGDSDIAVGYQAVEIDTNLWEIQPIPPVTKANLTVTDPALYGTLTTDPAEGEVEIGASVTVTAIPATNYHLVKITTNGVELAKSSPAEFAMPADDVTVAAVFEIDTYDITIQAPEHGTIETSITNDVGVGVIVTVTTTAEPGYVIENLKANGQDVTDGTFTMPAADVTLTAEAKEIMVTKVELDITSTNVVVDEDFTLTATVTPQEALRKEIAWTTSDDNIATVENGVVQPISEGTVTITATNAASGAFATCTVTVSAPEPDVPSYIGDDPTLQSQWAEWSKDKQIAEPEAESTKEAFLLNCTLDKLDEAKAAFKCTSITVNSDGTVTVTTPDGYNGYLYIEGKATLDATSWNFTKQATDKFFRAVLSTENKVNVE